MPRARRGNTERNPDLVAELVRLNVDILPHPGNGDDPGRKARRPRTIPIVMVYVGDPIASGIVTSLARPEANVTGFFDARPRDGPERGSSLLRGGRPHRFSRVAVLIHSA